MEESSLKRRPTALTHVAFNLLAALDTGKYGDVTIPAVKRELESGDIFAFLEDRLRRDIDLSLIGPFLRKEIQEEWADIASSVDERRKFGVESGGIALLLAYAIEGVQRRLSKVGRGAA